MTVKNRMGNPAKASEHTPKAPKIYGELEEVLKKPKHDSDDKIPRIAQVGGQSSPMRKRGYSDIDDCNLAALRLNTKASLSK